MMEQNIEKSRKGNVQINPIVSQNNYSIDTVEIKVKNGEFLVDVRLTSYEDHVLLETKDSTDLEYGNGVTQTTYSMSEAFNYVEILANTLQQQWINGYRNYLEENEPEYTGEDTDEELLVMLEASRVSM